MRNDRGKRGGKGGAKGGKGDSRGGQPRRGGRGGGGGGSGKRPAGSADAAAGVGNGNALSAVSKAQRRAGSRANKKAKTGEPGVLWSPGKGKGAEDRASLDTGGGRNGDVQNLSVLAKEFKERYGEEVVAPEDDDDGMVTGSSVFETPKRKGRLSGGAKPRTSVEEAARSMSPARLAAEAQKARARAREERFGGGGGGGSSSKPSSSPAPPARPFPVGKPPDPPRGAPPAAAVSKVPANRAASGQGDKNGKRTISVTTASSQAQQLSGGKSTVRTAAPSGSTPADGLGGSSSGSAPPTAVSPLASTKGAPLPVSATSAAAAVPVLVTPDAEEVDASAASKTGGRAAATPVQAEAIPMDETPPATVGTAAPKRPAPEGGDVAAAEPPVKKVLTLPSSQSPPATGGKIHTLRLRLRTDLEADSKQPTPTAPSPAAGGGAEERKGFEPPNPPADGGVEECKGFDPPNLPKKAATVSSAGSNPSTIAAPSTGLKKPSVASISTAASAAPAAPTTAAPATTPTAAAAPAPATAAPAPAAPAATPTAVASRLSVPAEGSTPIGSALTREGSWGPSFGIPSTPAGTPPPTPAPSPDVAAPNKTNPWILSPEAPTFGRNRGRPLAQAFMKPSPPPRGSSSSSGGASAASSTGAAGVASATRSAGEAASVQPDSRSSSSSSSNGGGCSDGSISEGRLAPGGNGTPATSRPPAGTTPCHASPSPSPQGGTRGGDVANPSPPPTHPLPRAGASVGTNAQRPPSDRPSAGRLPLQGRAAAAAAAGGGSVAALPAGSAVEAAPGVAAATDVGAAAPSGQVVLGVRLVGKAGELLERLKREREESLDFERKLTQALMDL